MRAEQRRRRRRRGDERRHRALERRGVRVVDERRLHGRRAVVVRHALLAEQPPDRLRIDRAQADVRARRRGHRPREAPAVAVEHRQRPQVDRVVAELGLDHLAERVQVRAAVRVDDALRAAGRARGVVDRDRLLLVAQQRRHARRVARGDQRLVLVTQPHDLDAGGRLGRQRLELGVDEQHARSGVLEDVADLRGAQPHVDRHEHAAGRRHRVVELEQLGHVRAQRGHAIVALQPARAQRRGEPVHALAQLGVGAAHARRPPPRPGPGGSSRCGAGTTWDRARCG